jgi:hypothetical protein
LFTFTPYTLRMKCREFSFIAIVICIVWQLFWM